MRAPDLTQNGTAGSLPPIANTTSPLPEYILAPKSWATPGAIAGLVCGPIALIIAVLGLVLAVPGCRVNFAKLQKRRRRRAHEQWYGSSHTNTNDSSDNDTSGRKHSAAFMWAAIGTVVTAVVCMVLPRARQDDSRGHMSDSSNSSRASHESRATDTESGHRLSDLSGTTYRRDSDCDCASCNDSKFLQSNLKLTSNIAEYYGA
jgi:hypothetical protein